MDDIELNQIARDPRYAGRLKKKTKKEKEAFKNLFEGLDEEETFKDKRGRPWPSRPLKYAKELIRKEEEKSDDDESTATSSESDSDSSTSEGEEVEETLADLQGYFDVNKYVMIPC